MKPDAKEILSRYKISEDGYRTEKDILEAMEEYASLSSNEKTEPPEAKQTGRQMSDVDIKIELFFKNLQCDFFHFVHSRNKEYTFDNFKTFFDSVLPISNPKEEIASTERKNIITKDSVMLFLNDSLSFYKRTRDLESEQFAGEAQALNGAIQIIEGLVGKYHTLILPVPLTEGKRESLESMFARHQEFAQIMFPNSTWESSLRGLEREIKEVELAKADYQVIDGQETRTALALEYIDCFMYLLDGMKRVGFSIDDLKHFFALKQQINLGREWKQNSDGSYSHIKSTEGKENK